jgi:hypothetical protein
MSTFNEDDPQRKDVKIRSDTEKPRPKTEFDKYIDSLNEKYVAKCKEMAQQDEFIINIRSGAEDIPTKFTRKHLTQGELDAIEDLRITAQDLRGEETGNKASRDANKAWYLKIGESILYNTKAGRRMNKEDFDNSVNRDIKPILDGCIMAEMSGVPN